MIISGSWEGYHAGIRLRDWLSSEALVLADVFTHVEAHHRKIDHAET